MLQGLGIHVLTVSKSAKEKSTISKLSTASSANDVEYDGASLGYLSKNYW
ncbi:MAG: hypothetical protein ACTS7E_02895 [Arsenophonus sp. NC-CH8-MAG3]